jgi:hypothetical protein
MKKHSVGWRFLSAAFVFTCFPGFSPLGSAQDSPTAIDKSLIPAVGDSVIQFVPAGWKIEAQVKGDLNGDALPDFAVKLIEDKPAKGQDGKPVERYRALVVLFQNKDGKLTRSGVADKLLLCTGCAGHLDDDAPTSVRIENGSLVIRQESGGEEGDTLYRFRYEAGTQRFRLLGYDFKGFGPRPSSSSNYLTGLLTITRGKGAKRKTERIRLPIEKIYLEDVDRGQEPP